MLKELTLFGEQDKVQIAIDRLRMFEPKEPYFLAFSAGKDSLVIHQLAVEAGVKFQAHYNHTTVDPPELIYFIRDNYPDVIVDYPKLTMWKLIIKKKIPPTPKVRYCCSYLKESAGMGRTVITGVRWAESARRKNSRSLLELNTYSKNGIMLNSDNDEARRMFETCSMKGKHILNIIIDLTDDEVWEFIHSRGLKYCNLYDCGFKRIGCIGCPLAGAKNMKMEFERYPKYYDAYIRSFDRMLKHRAETGLISNWKNAEEVMQWWLRDLKLKQDDEKIIQLELDEFL